MIPFASTASPTGVRPDFQLLGFALGLSGLLLSCAGRVTESTECREGVFCPAGTDCLDDVCVAPSCAAFGDGFGCVLPGRGLGNCQAGACQPPDAGVGGVEVSGVVIGEHAPDGVLLALVPRAGVRVTVAGEPQIPSTDTEADGRFSLTVPRNSEVVLQMDAAEFATSLSRVYSVAEQPVTIEDPLVIVTDEFWARLRFIGGHNQSGPIAMVSYVNESNQFGTDQRAQFTASPGCAQGPVYWDLTSPPPRRAPGNTAYATFGGCEDTAQSISAQHMAYEQCVAVAPDVGSQYRVRMDLGYNVFAGWFRCK